MERGGESHHRPGEKNLARLKMSGRRKREIDSCGEEHADEGKQIRRGDDSAFLFRRRTMLDESVERHGVEAAENSEQTKIRAHRPDAQAVPRNEKSEQRHSHRAEWNQS